MRNPLCLVLPGLFLVACSSGDIPETGTPPTVEAIVATPPSPYLHLPYRIDRYTTEQVDRPVEPIRGPMPSYPAALKAGGIEGVVRLRFVVLASGRVDSASIEVVNASRPEFSAPAVEALRAWQFRPAEIRGKAVAQQVEQNVRFRLGRRQ